ncbi:MAG: tRNA pseudouridine(55) synthase TruB [Thermomicrobiales bacterium]|nr:tRNA pseudouridine(55) synthase TruB [Thermomicrobiales bacterium]
MQDLPALLLGSDEARRWRQGGSAPADGRASGVCRVYDERGAWVGLGRADASGCAWRPAKTVGDAP